MPLLPKSVTSPPIAVKPVPPFAAPSVPVTPVVSGNPVQLVKTPLVGVPKSGVVSVGEVAKTSSPDPVSFVTAVARFALVGVAKKVATPAAKPETPVLIGRPVQFVSVPLVGVPKIGVTNVGDVANTSAPVPVSPVTAAARLAVLGVPKNAATPVPRPDTPVAMGRAVPFVRLTLDGVPSAGVTNVGELARTTAPVPVTVAAISAVPLAASTGVLSEVVSVNAGVLVGLATDPAKPLAETIENSETVPPPEK